jgi:hypothetical protein
MNKIFKTLSLATCLSVISGCSSTTIEKVDLTPVVTNLEEHNTSLNNVADNINNLDIKLDSVVTNNDKILSTCLTTLDKTTKLLEVQNTELSNITKQLKKRNNSLTEEKPQMLNVVDKNTKISDGKMILGEVEWIYIREADTSFESRIDSGASVSSISATDIEQFERDGKKWYRFNIPVNNKNSITVEAPWVRYARIKQASTNGKVTERPVVKLSFKIGNYAGSSTFSLTDRSNMQYALLVGREFIKDIAIVDVSKKHVQGKLVNRNSIGGLKIDKDNKFIPNSRDEVKDKDSKNEKVVQAKKKDLDGDDSNQNTISVKSENTKTSKKEEKVKQKSESKKKTSKEKENSEK